ncbi:hypothetical protein [Nitratireductor basaltis]|uniref:Uncharacterized protein n=1 Tax=Nitratireductor basaltis TaxID=472175 RepID=A0A084U896_9HYPH|nr:hypothetical protein [Nitratireductor basaltis]KFB09182.1 hypothetical protein EL18_00197 [Nitratireductor basaltis]
MAFPTLADALPDFAHAIPVTPRAPAPRAQQPQRNDAAVAERRIEEATAKAREEAIAELTDRHQAELAAIRAHHEEEILSLQQQLGAKMAIALINSLQTSEQRVMDAAGEMTARVLGLALTEKLQQKALEEFTARLQDALKDEETLRIRIEGNAVMLEALRGRLGDRAHQFELIETTNPELSAEINESLLETRLYEWSRQLSELLA